MLTRTDTYGRHTMYIVSKTPTLACTPIVSIILPVRTPNTPPFRIVKIQHPFHVNQVKLQNMLI